MSGTAPKRPGDDGTRLDRAPGERYAARAAQTDGGRAGVEARAQARGRRSLVAAVLIADTGAVAWFAIAMLGLDPGLIVIAAFTGWLIALALVWYGRGASLADGRTRMAIAAFLGGWAVVGGMLLDWVVSVTVLEGALGPIGYVLARYGVVIPLIGLAVGAGVAAFRAR
jgi:hypothetical protein